MATLANLLVLVDENIGTGVTTNFTSQKKTNALNAIGKRIIRNYNIQEFVTESTVSFTSGVGSLPSDYLRTLTEYSSANLSGDPYNSRDLFYETDDTDYTKETITNFDRSEGNSLGKTWTVKEGNILIYPEETINLKLRYTKDFTKMSDPSDESGLPVSMDEAHAMLAVALIYFRDQQFEVASQIQFQADRLLSQALARQLKDYGNRRTNGYTRALQGQKITW